MKPPGFPEKEALRFTDSLPAIKQVSECRNIRAFRMASLLRLFQLLRIAKQNKASSSRGTGQHIGKRHLARLIDKEDLDGIHELRARPQPWSSAEHLYSAPLQVS